MADARAIAIQDGARIRDELERVGKTQRRFARDIGVREATISDAIRGKPISPDMLFRIALGIALAGPTR